MKSFKDFIMEELIGLAKPRARLSGGGKAWNPPRRGEEHKAGKETWAVEKDVDKNHKKLAKQHKELHKGKKTGDGKGAVEAGKSFFKGYLGNRPPRG
jgi:hypothetical protein